MRQVRLQARTIPACYGAHEDTAMTFKLQIDCDNAAFSDNPLEEVGRILKELSEKIDANEHGKIYDYNGNKVGFYKLEE